uniref:TPR1-like CTLH-containing domain-containing protein n=1 Tax=Noccaea caerulescens TaxID=107243 RepID=A0A1J3DJ10_NOCCA
MDSMSADLMRGLETSLPNFYFDRERFGALLVSGDMIGAWNYLSEFTKFDSNYQSNLMFYLVCRQRYCNCLIEGNLPCAVAFLVLGKTGLNEIGLAETKKDFIDNDLQRLFSVHKKLLDARAEGYTVDLVPFANDTTNEMFQMMNHLVATNPDLLQKQKKDFSSQMRFI